MWLFDGLSVHTFAELCLSPVGLSAMTKLAPARIVSLMMGVWFLGASVGNFMGGQAGVVLRSDAARPTLLDGRASCRSSPASSCSSARAVRVDGGCMGGSRDKLRWRSTNTSRSATSRSRLSPRRQDAARRRRTAHAALLLRAEAPRQPPALRLPPRAQRRAAVLGGSERSVARPGDQAAGDARRGSPDRIRHFEGVIPAGYGAGIVMLWDRGTWTPEVDDVDAALKKGDLKFTLDGFKLKGSWVLVRTEAAMAPAAARDRSLAADQAPRRLGGRRRHRRVRAAQREERGRLRGDPRAGQPGDLASRIGRPRAARPAPCSGRSSNARSRSAKSGRYRSRHGRRRTRPAAATKSRRRSARLKGAPPRNEGCEEESGGYEEDSRRGNGAR